ncbi:ion transporter [Nocardiopsis suaedae]|uniref:Ion transporter n=1 Tax=Nocardiopsis suaedae TaxID=3018444 RepID=A0ABT4TMM2_9ACTN|nr:ion transporter [Nocardiopsis suaedae]MDA2805946.1 ion transporter [Nocardiopsis suaedae]
MGEPTLRGRAVETVDAGWFRNTVIVLILLNAVTLGLETYEGLLRAWGPAFRLAETTFVGLFAAELLLKMYARGRAFFRDPWNWFDLAVVGVALVPASAGFSVLRLLRILRILRLISVVPQMRQIVSALFRAVPGMGTVIGLLLIIVYTSAVLGEKLFGDTAPAYFGDLGTSLFTLFMVMTTEDWPDVAEAVMAVHPAAWVFFVCYLVATTFIILNLVIGVIVTALEQEVNAERWREDQELEQEQHDAVMVRLDALTEQVALLRAQVGESAAPQGEQGAGMRKPSARRPGEGPSSGAFGSA